MIYKEHYEEDHSNPHVITLSNALKEKDEACEKQLTINNPANAYPDLIQAVIDHDLDGFKCIVEKYSISNFYVIKDTYAKVDIDELAEYIDEKSLSSAFCVDSFNKIHRNINIMHWCLICDNDKILKLLVEKHNMRLDVIRSDGYSHLLPLSISLKFNQFKCLKYMWEYTPWYFEDIRLIREMIIEIITYAHYRYTNIKEKESPPKAKEALVEAKSLIKYFLKSDTLVSYFEFMSISDKFKFITDVLSFRNYVVKDEMAKNLDISNLEISMSEELIGFRKSYLGDNKTDPSALSIRRYMSESPFSIYTAIIRADDEDSHEEKFNISDSDINKFVYNYFKFAQEFVKDVIQNYHPQDVNPVGRGLYKLASNIKKSSVYKKLSEVFE